MEKIVTLYRQKFQDRGLTLNKIIIFTDGCKAQYKCCMTVAAEARLAKKWKLDYVQHIFAPTAAFKCCAATAVEALSQLGIDAILSLAISSLYNRILYFCKF